ncbi:MAG: hypothetical protein QQW96_18340 [Tychonema bourrellyi B0820]|uniref:Uncharacterized protein n=1 Tax=Tychonema bourrellyi FEM_GT703 TaxID=2040638 RepID=A0A2G4F4W5_9CYAN|nr:hypothetical protein [Tychonema bourrellyi]MDQ2099594.1 hypothetical protein [Tychonema bourrellyi B0820]PHX56765.1 hypothetical protein CP500_003925 [Tychonema bourrellyi FEM_GT703]
MKEKLSVLVCLLIGVTLGGGFAELSIANPGLANSKTQAADISDPSADLSNVVIPLPRNWV